MKKFLLLHEKAFSRLFKVLNNALQIFGFLVVAFMTFKTVFLLLIHSTLPLSTQVATVFIITLLGIWGRFFIVFLIIIIICTHISKGKSIATLLITSSVMAFLSEAFFICFEISAKFSDNSVILFFVFVGTSTIVKCLQHFLKRPL